MSQTLQLKIRYQPHTGQQSFHESKARFRLLACGRRWGKTISGANEAIRVATSCPPESVGFCVAPTFWHTQKQSREFLLYCPKELVQNIHRGEHKITLIGNRHIWFRSADNPDSLRSEGLDWCWVDEGGQMKEEAWILALRPALMDKEGIAWFTGTPKGKNWYYRIFTRGQDSEQKDYESWTFSSLDNPYINKSEIEDFARDMPKLAYQQEILGMFLEDVGSVFRGVRNCIEGELELPVKSKRYVVGVDWAKHEDYTVVCVLDEKGHLCHFDRFSELDWVFQRKRVVDICQRYNRARLLTDSTGVGDPVLDELRREDVRVEGYKFTNASKKDLIENLSMCIEKHTVSYPDVPVLVNELGIFGYEISPSGNTRYHAPEGYHDDCVIALALACWLNSKPRGRIII